MSGWGCWLCPFFRQRPKTVVRVREALKRIPTGQPYRAARVPQLPKHLLLSLGQSMLLAPGRSSAPFPGSTSLSSPGLGVPLLVPGRSSAPFLGVLPLHSSRCVCEWCRKRWVVLEVCV